MIDSILSIVHVVFDLNRYQVLIVFRVDVLLTYFVTFFYGFFPKRNNISIWTNYEIIQSFKVNLVINIHFIAVLKIDIVKVISTVMVLDGENRFHVVNVVVVVFDIKEKEKQKNVKV